VRLTRIGDNVCTGSEGGPDVDDEGRCGVFRLLVGMAIGYVLGSRAGRERYEQIMRWASQVADHPAVQGGAGFIQAKVSDVLPGGNKQH
jgi:hypothetical protein